MPRIVTLAERKSAEAERRQRAVAELCAVLTHYASEHGGRFLLFGSAARGAMRYDSDVDILIDFPPDRLDDAWNFAERACWTAAWNRTLRHSAPAGAASTSGKRLISGCWRERRPLDRHCS